MHCCYDLHQIVFEKIELIKWPIFSYEEAQKQLRLMMPFVLAIMIRLGANYKEDPQEDFVVRVEPTGQEFKCKRSGDTSFKECFAIAETDSYDIMLNSIEVGSYYLKRLDVDGEELYYVCGTGLALPRFSVALNRTT